MALIAYVVVLLRRARDAGTAAHGVRIESLLLFVYVVIAFFSMTYLALAENGEFTGLETRADAISFTVTALATVGYGDITATGQNARMIATVQMAFDIDFIGVGAKILGSLVVDQGRRARRQAAAPDGDEG